MEDLQGGTLALEHRYDILEPRARDGALTLYQGQQDPFERPVWVEVYEGFAQAEEALGARMVERLKKSARQASGLQSAGILRVVDYGEVDRATPFVIAERSTHHSLADLLGREGTLPARLTCQIIAQIAEVLAPVHQQRSAHGGLSARWVYLAEGDLKTLSVGHFQRAITPAELGKLGISTPALGLIEAFGPEFYDAGVQAGAGNAVSAGENAYPGVQDLGPGAMSPAGDVWALGVLAYTALVGIHPFFDAPLSLEEAGEVLCAQAPRSLQEFGVDAEISAAVERALAVDPRARFANARDFADALRAAMREEIAAPAEIASASAREPVESSDTPPARLAGALTNPVAERDPGPSDRLMSVALMLLVLSNLAWLFYVVAR